MFTTESIYQKAWFCFSNALFQWAPLFKGTVLIKMVYTCFCFLKKGVSLLPFNLRKLFEGFFPPDNLSWHFHIIKTNHIAHKTVEDAEPSVNYALQLNTFQIRISSLCFVFLFTFPPIYKNACVLKERMDFWLTENY